MDNLPCRSLGGDRPGLDEAGIGLLDCPDIVSDEAFGLGSPQARRELLGKAATLCSAFIVVTSAESSRDTTLGDLLRIAADLMPGIPRLLAVNKIRPRQTPDQVYETFQPLARNHGIETIYAAYDFDVPASRPFIPGIRPDSGIAGADRAGCRSASRFLFVVGRRGRQSTGGNQRRSHAVGVAAAT